MVKDALVYGDAEVSEERLISYARQPELPFPDYMKRLPVGEQSFEKLILNKRVYVDKTPFVQQLLKEKIIVYVGFEDTQKPTILFFLYTLRVAF